MKGFHATFRAFDLVKSQEMLVSVVFARRFSVFLNDRWVFGILGYWAILLYTFDHCQPEVCVRDANRVANQTSVPPSVSHCDICQHQELWICVDRLIVLHMMSQQILNGIARTADTADTADITSHHITLVVINEYTQQTFRA